MDMGDIPANSTLIFEVEVMDIQTPMEYKPYNGAGKDTITLKSGLRYIVIAKGDPNQKAKPEQTASVFYAGYLMDGKKFDGNFGGFDPLQLKVVDGRVIRGWQEMLPLMNKGMKVRAIIPPSLGYGARDMGVIPPNSTLIFDMYLYDLK
jgi:FKBP-type peptidyl-prolyl cis-trans isomerase FkpA